ncbi:hypothetical protein PTSG_10349 [Salpingoeca rosetta]|uniref:Uncharacterized protein n=1 Tax=Salpingoeca rosetta (strain ATCC 50818 / BSB-021) TaxID=946362 RepID=F2UR20_SALR5|nr:uncharacterized protein PTSG_10349 [Salpingoeca rosetta]EGD80075.1 hypothetical protein PTSG_10349 [Salpingoeca rosetta]|eukprot:XP_004988400.1 hypothetical protein PTSG_10349 [Salpingoeca rosetta]
MAVPLAQQLRQDGVRERPAQLTAQVQHRRAYISQETVTINNREALWMRRKMELQVQQDRIDQDVAHLLHQQQQWHWQQQQQQQQQQHWHWQQSVAWVQREVVRHCTRIRQSAPGTTRGPVRPSSPCTRSWSTP